MNGARLARHALALALWLVGGCASIPDPGGARLERADFSIRTDVSDPAFVSSWAPLVARDRDRLVPLFGFELGRPFTVILCTSEAKFNEYADEFERSGPYLAGFTSFAAGPCIFVEVTASSQPPRLVLAHELSHLFDATCWSDAPKWWSEGLAMELSHSNATAIDYQVIGRAQAFVASLPKARDKVTPELRAQGIAVLAELDRVNRGEVAPSPDKSVWDRCPLQEVMLWSDAQITARLAALDDWEGGSEQYLLAGAVLRYELQTQHPKTLLSLRPPELPKAPDFLEWLHQVRADGSGPALHELYPPVDAPL